MGQQFSSDALGQNNDKGFTNPAWYNPDYSLTHASISACKASISIITEGKIEVFHRVQGFGFQTPLDFFYRQFFYRLAVLSPMFIRKCLNIDSHYDGTLRANDILSSEYAKAFFNSILLNPIHELYQFTTSDLLESHLLKIVNHLHLKYQLDASLFADIAFVILNVLSDCLGKAFEPSSACWIGLFSCEIKLFIELNAVNTNTYGVFSIKETMLKLNQPFIDWSDGLLGTQFAPVDRQHQWLLTLVNILIHICSNNVMKISVQDVIDALFDYACIHFTEEELFFIKSPYPLLLLRSCLNGYELHGEGGTPKSAQSEFLNTIKKIRFELNMSNESALSQKTLDYMISWLTNHIRVVDKQMVDACVAVKNPLYSFCFCLFHATAVF